MKSLFKGVFISGILAVLVFAAEGTVVYTKINAPAVPKLESLPLKDKVTRNGITWTFEKPARLGQFINGDLYVIGPVTVVMIDPKPLFGEEVKNPIDDRSIKESLFKGKFARNGSTLNLPAVVPPNKITKRTVRSGFDSRMDMAAYDWDQFTKLPIAMKPGDSLFSSISNEPMDGGFSIKALAVLTCLAEPQPADAFRPSYCKTSLSKIYLARDLRRELLLKLPLPETASKVKPAEVNDYFKGVWLDTVGFGRAMPRKAFFGADVSVQGGQASLLLLLNYPPEEKEPLIINMVQIGIDYLGLVRGGLSWAGEGGVGSGRKWLITFAGLMLDEKDMYAVSRSFPDALFQEDDQTVFCPVEFMGKKYEKGWTGAKVIWTGHYGYHKGEFLNGSHQPRKSMDAYGPVELFPPAEWPTPWSQGSEGSRRSSNSGTWVAEALAARLMHAERYWEHDAFFAYVDRWMTEDDAPFWGAINANVDKKLAAAKDEKEKKELEAAKAQMARTAKGGTVAGNLGPLVKELWVKYRDNLPGRDDKEKALPAAMTWK